MGRRVLITGSSGRLGRTLVRALGRTHDVVGLDVRAPSKPEELSASFEGSITDVDLVAEAMEGVDTVVHCAAHPGPVQPFHTLIETNVKGTFILLEEAGKRAEVERFIFASSIQWHGLHEEYGGRQAPEHLPVSEEHPSLATGYYDTSKVLAEHLCQTYVRRFGKPCVAMRPGWIITEDLEASFRAVPPPDYAHLNDYVGASDLARAVELLLEYDPPEGYDAFLFHADDQRSTLPSADLVEQYFPGVSVDAERLGVCEGFGALVDCTRAKERLGWQPAFRCQR